MVSVLEKIRLTEFSHGGGCGCKIAPAVLSELLAATPIRGLPKELLVGSSTSMEWPPAMGIPASAQTDSPPARILPITSSGNLSSGMPTSANAKIGFAPMA